MFLRRIKVPYFSKKNLFIGGNVSIYGRQMKVIDFADKYTAKKFQIENESTFAMIKPNAFQNAGSDIIFLR